MPSQKPRLNLTIPDDLNHTITRLSELTGRPKSTLILDMLVDYTPILERTVIALESIKKDKENGKTIAKDFGNSMLVEAGIIMGNISKEVKEYD